VTFVICDHYVLHQEAFRLYQKQYFIVRLVRFSETIEKIKISEQYVTKYLQMQKNRYELSGSLKDEKIQTITAYIYLGVWQS